MTPEEYIHQIASGLSSESLKVAGRYMRAIRLWQHQTGRCTCAAGKLATFHFILTWLAEDVQLTLEFYSWLVITGQIKREEKVPVETMQELFKELAEIIEEAEELAE